MSRIYCLERNPLLMHSILVSMPLTRSRKNAFLMYCVFGLCDSQENNAWLIDSQLNGKISLFPGEVFCRTNISNNPALMVLCDKKMIYRDGDFDAFSIYYRKLFRISETSKYTLKSTWIQILWRINVKELQQPPRRIASNIRKSRD